MSRKWALVRVGMGIAQVMGATATLVFMAQTGMSQLTVAGVVATLLLVVLSRLLFSRKDRKD
jgi:hypothetical protein